MKKGRQKKGGEKEEKRNTKSQKTKNRGMVGKKGKWKAIRYRHGKALQIDGTIYTPVFNQTNSGRPAFPNLK